MEALTRHPHHPAAPGAIVASHWGQGGAAWHERSRRDVEARPAVSRFEAVATHSDALCRTGKDAPGILLAAAAAAGRIGPPELQPLWAEEAMHRAYSILRLFVALKRQAGSEPGLSSRLELNLASEIAACLQALDAPSTEDRVPCSFILREIMHDLVALFGPGVGHIDLHCRVERVCLPWFKRRALVLLACELVVNALLHAFVGRVTGDIDVTLSVRSSNMARLLVVDNGVGIRGKRTARKCGIAGGLAAVLGSELHYGCKLRSTSVSARFEL